MSSSLGLLISQSPALVGAIPSDPHGPKRLKDCHFILLYWQGRNKAKSPAELRSVSLLVCIPPTCITLCYLFHKHLHDNLTYNMFLKYLFLVFKLISMIRNSSFLLTIGCINCKLHMAEGSLGIKHDILYWSYLSKQHNPITPQAEPD